MDGKTLLAQFAVFKAAVFWHNPAWTGPKDTKHLPGYADANPDEAGKVAAYVQALAAGQKPSPPAVSTKHGKGIVGMLQAASAPSLVVEIQGDDTATGKLAAAIRSVAA